MALAFKIKDIDERKLAAHGASTKLCSGCDPDVPGHQDRHTCTVCRGTGREPLSFMSTLIELNNSRQEEAQGNPGRGYKGKGHRPTGRGRTQSVEDDPDLFLEY